MWVVVLFTITPGTARGIQRPDVLVLVVDDLNDWNTLLDSNAPIPTPNMQRLAERGTLFTRAYCASPACNPSRVSTWTGLRPTTSGVYGNRSDWRAALPEHPTLMQVLRSEGYTVSGAGKVFHHHLNGAFHDDESFDSFQPMRPQLYPHSKLNQAPEYGSRNTDWGVWPPTVEESVDHRSVDFCIRQLEKTASPLMLVCGIFKPHSPFFAPKEFHGRVAGGIVPLRLDSDWDDLPTGAASLLRSKRWFWRGMQDLDHRRPGSYDDFLQSYAACVAFADFQIGRVLQALESRTGGEDAIIILWSDHGFHLGEKAHIEKFALWEKSTRVPLVMVAPGVTKPGTVCDTPVDLTCIYPTVLDLLNVSADTSLDGRSVVPMLSGNEAPRDRIALTTYLPGNHAVRSANWRYIKYQDGTEELYDHRRSFDSRDPHEWTNLAGDPRFDDILEQHRAHLPQRSAASIHDLKSRN